MMFKYIFKQWRKKPLGIILIMLGYTIGILVLSIGLSSVEGTKNNLNDMYSGNPDNYSFVRIVTTDSVNCSYSDISDFLTNLSSKAEVQIINFGKGTVIKENNNHEYSLIPVIFNNAPEWNIPIINGRYFEEDEAKGNLHKVIIGKEIARKLSIDVGKDKININNEKYDVVGISGRIYKETQWDNIIYIPIKALPQNIKLSFINMITVDKSGSRYLDLSLLIRKNKQSIENFLLNGINSKFASSHPLIRYINLNKMDRSSLRNAIIFTVVASGVILLITLINVINLSLFWILDRRKQIAIMMSTGATNKFICKRVIVEMVLMAIISSIIAVVVQKILWCIFGKNLINNEMYFDISWVNLIGSILVATICGLISSIFPVLSTLKMNPAEALRFE